MMTKQEHIDYWIKTAEKDWKAVQNIYKAKEYMYALFFAHLVLEKLLKAHWVKDNAENTPPKKHNLLYLLEETNLEFETNDKDFLGLMNQFQLEGRYPDYKFELIKKYKAAPTKKILNQVNIVRICLLKSL
jgi:HEPN domain-containing protein